MLTLTPAERLVIFRRRARWTQADMADLLAASRNRYEQWERGQRDGVPHVRLEPLELFEWCYIHRRRKGWTLAEIEERSDFKGKWVHRVERGETDCQPLAQWWLDQINQAESGDSHYCGLRGCPTEIGSACTVPHCPREGRRR